MWNEKPDQSVKRNKKTAGQVLKYNPKINKNLELLYLTNRSIEQKQPKNSR